jgi:hypothetical protein
MRAYDIEGGKVVLQPEFIAVPQNKVIWDRDKNQK